MNCYTNDAIENKKFSIIDCDFSFYNPLSWTILLKKKNKIKDDTLHIRYHQELQEKITKC